MTTIKTKHSAAQLLSGANLSYVWGQALVNSLRPGAGHQQSLLMSINNFDGFPKEDSVIRTALDEVLRSKGFPQIESVADTIFPEPLYRLAKYDRHALYKIYHRALPRFKAMDRDKNGSGMYFERLTCFGSGPFNGNQLEFLIDQYEGRTGVRASMFQAAVFDPARDHRTAAQIPFPCLQHVTFVPANGTLTINGFYATQQLFFKTYGNLLGLAQLGRFVAKEMKLRLCAVNCFAGLEKLERINKSDNELQNLVELLKKQMEIEI